MLRHWVVSCPQHNLQFIYILINICIKFTDRKISHKLVNVLPNGDSAFQNETGRQTRNSSQLKEMKQSIGGFHLNLLVFPFVYQFNFRIGFQFIHHLQMTSLEGFQQHFNIISKSICCGFYMKKNLAITLISFAGDDCLSVQLPFELPFRHRFSCFQSQNPTYYFKM